MPPQPCRVTLALHQDQGILQGPIRPYNFEEFSQIVKPHASDPLGKGGRYSSYQLDFYFYLNPIFHGSRKQIVVV